MPVPPLSTSARSNIPLRLSNSRRVFLCDDDLDFTTELAVFLNASGLEVRTLRDGKSPVEIFEFFQPTVILVDIFMPPPDGFEVINHIASNVRKQAVSVILASGDEKMLQVAAHFCRARDIRLSAALHKPISIGKLLAVLNDQGTIL